MSDLVNVFLVLVMVMSSWPSLVYVVRQFTNPAQLPRPGSLHSVRLGINGTTCLTSEHSPHPADPPVCMAKLIMLRHRMQQTSARRAQQYWAVPVPKNVYGNSRYRPSSAWINSTTVGRRLSSNR